MFTSDRPIETINEDALKRANFSKQLAKAILSYSKEDNFVISLCGKWGSGKTSIINLIIEEIEAITKNTLDEEKPIIVKFNPWNYSDCPQLISQFFAEIMDSLNLKDSSESLKKVGDAIRGYSSLFEYTQFIPVVGKFFSPLTSSIANLGEDIEEKGEEKGSLKEKKKVVTKALAEQKQKLIIVIDDIDRLNNQQIRAVFQLVNSVAGFPNIIYLLSFDREVVARALQEEQNCNGEEYLEKIVQVPFDVPEVSHELITVYFLNRFAELVYANGTDDDFDESHWQTIFSKCITPYLKGIRDVKRILNSFEFSYNLMKEETNITDLLALTTLHICAPTIYEWICCHKSTLTGGLEYFGAISGNDQKENASKYLEIFKVTYPNSPEKMLNIVQAIFPKFSWITGGYNRTNYSEAELRKSNSVASSEKFDRYFDLCLESIPVTQGDVNESIGTYSKVQLESYLLTLLQAKKINYYLGELSSRLEEMEPDRVILFISVLAKILENDEMYKRDNVLALTPAYKCTSILKDLFRLNEEGNFEILMDMIKQADVSGLCVLASIIETVENAWDTENQYTEKGYRFVSKIELKNIEQVFLNKVEEIVDNIFSEDQCDRLYHLWGRINREKRDAHIRQLMSDSINIPKMLSKCVGTWSSSNGISGWSFQEDSFREYISPQDAYNGIRSIKNNRFSELEFKYKEIAVAYVLWYELEKKDDHGFEHDVSKQIVDQKIAEWESID